MSGVDPECHAQPSAYSYRSVCVECFDDADLRRRVEANDGPPGCSFCGQDDAATMPFDDMAEFIGERIDTFFGRAVEELPYDGREGGYQGSHSSTDEVLGDELILPRDDGALMEAFVDAIGDEEWCDYDWTSLDPDDSLKSSWESFCEIVKYDRRFFFHNVGADALGHPDERSPLELLRQIGRSAAQQGLIRTEPAGYRLYRARIRHGGEQHTTAKALGPPPPEVATQSNRMNPPGISMFYGADDPDLAVAETRGHAVSIGVFETLRPVRILDLATLPDVPGFYSEASRLDRFSLAFLSDFSDIIIQPVPRSDRTQIDYIPTQVFTEFLRDFPYEAGPISGVRYRSATGAGGFNVVLFATPHNVVDASSEPEFGPPRDRWLRLVDVQHQD